MCPLECGPLSRDDCVGRRGSLLPGLRGLAAVESALELREVTLARCDRLGTLSQRLLEPLELGGRLGVTGVPFLGELPCQPEQLGPVDVHVGLLGGAAVAAWRPRIEALLPAVYAGSFHSARTGPWCPFLGCPFWWCPFRVTSRSPSREVAPQAPASAGSAGSRRRADGRLRRRDRRRARERTGARLPGRGRCRLLSHGSARRA